MSVIKLFSKLEYMYDIVVFFFGNLWLHNEHSYTFCIVGLSSSLMTVHVGYTISLASTIS